MSESVLSAWSTKEIDLIATDAEKKKFNEQKKKIHARRKLHLLFSQIPCLTFKDCKINGV